MDTFRLGNHLFNIAQFNVSWLTERKNPLVCILADQYLKVCDDTPSLAMPPH